MPLLAVLFLALLVRLLFFCGYAGTDDVYYTFAAHRVSVDDLNAFDSHFAVRSAVVLPVAAVYRLLAVSPTTTALWPLLASLGEVVIAFALGRRLFGERVGLLAGLLLAFFPLDVIFATELFPCVPIGFFAGLGLWFFVRDPQEQGRASLFLAGVSLALATLAGDTAWLCLLPVAYYFVVYARRRTRYLFLGFGFVAVIAVEALLYAYLAGDPLQRWRLLSRAVATMGTDAMSSGLGLAYMVNPFLRLMSEQELGLFPYFLLPALVFHVRRTPSDRSRFLVFWVVSIFLYTSYGTASPFRFAPMARLPRYLSSVTIPAMILLAAFLASLRPLVRNLALAALCLSSIACVWIDNGRAVMAPVRDVRAFLSTQARWVLDEQLLVPVLFYSGFRPPADVSVVVDSAEAAQRIETKFALLGTVHPIGELRNLHDAYAAFTGESEHGPTAVGAGATLVASFQPPDRLYYQLLRNPLFVKILSLTRDQYRMQGLHSLPNERIDVYHLP